MSTTLSFKALIDKPEWRPLANCPNAQLSGAGVCSDQRNDASASPFVYSFSATSQFQIYSPKSDEWASMWTTTNLSGSVAAGSGCFFAASQGPAGTLTTGATTTSVVLSTALPAAVTINQLANRGDGRGFKIRIIGNSSGGSGKVEEKIIVANTAGTTPTLTLESALTFTPASGDRYEILSGRVFFVTSGPNMKSYDVATNFLSAALTTTNLSAPTTDFSAVVLDEQYTPATQAPGTGFFGNLVATASGATSLTGQAASGDAAVATNEYRNFQIRIVQDTATPTAVGQRRRITSHTAGASPVYTVPTWTVTPSTTATFVIEGNNDILLWTAGSTSTFSYAAGGFAADAAWSTSVYAARGSAMSGGCSSVWPFGMTLDAGKLARYSFIYSFRGGNSTALDVLDIAAATAGTWSNTTTYGGLGTTINTGSSIAYDGLSNGGVYAYINISSTQRNMRFDCRNRVLEPYGFLRYAPGSPLTGNRMAVAYFTDGATTLSILHQWRPGNVEWFDIFLI